MDPIARCDWLPERVRWSHIARSVLPAVSRKKYFPESHIMNPLLTKFIRSRWLDIGLVLFCEFMDFDFVSVHKRTHTQTWPISGGSCQYPAILTSHLVDSPHLLCWLLFCNEKNTRKSLTFISNLAAPFFFTCLKNSKKKKPNSFFSAPTPCPFKSSLFHWRPVLLRFYPRVQRPKKNGCHLLSLAFSCG